ncbi:MAG: hypothetical protein AB202_03860 [Parcubacteria bacterium C7867-007]|nr:MAG: hypothetical protein AB202_03860 [Parcubacteria bacterium C7867-007]
MQAFHNDPKKKEEVLAALSKTPIGSDGIDYFVYEKELGIPNEVGQWEDAIANELAREEVQEFVYSCMDSVNVGADLSTLPAQIVLWQFEHPIYGLKNIRGIQKDLVLMGFCEELVALYRNELNGTPTPPQALQNLFERVAAAWGIEGERQRIASMQFARKWAWIGARKWAWIPTKGWSGGWKWLLAATRNRTRSSFSAMISAWIGARKWSRFWEPGTTRARALSTAFLECLNREKSTTAL